MVDVPVHGQVRNATVRTNGDSGRPQPLVLLFGGYGDAGNGMETESGFSRKASEVGFIAAYPRALGDPPKWDFAGMADLDFVDALLTELESRLCVDVSRVFVAGMSMGGGMAKLAGCHFPDRIAAIASVAGLYGPNYGDPCLADRPVPALAIHARGDPFVPYAGGPIGDGSNPDLPPVIGVEQWASDRAERNGCDSELQRRRLSADVEELSWTGCRVPMKVYAIRGGGHVWPGSPADAAKALPATDLVWDFFSRQILPPAGQPESSAA
jgi:polyhydroxybutyrate depolymerase